MSRCPHCSFNPVSDSDFCDRHRSPESAFEAWWRKNHPRDWWAKARGEPLDSKTRLAVWALAREAYLAGDKRLQNAKEKA